MGFGDVTAGTRKTLTEIEWHVRKTKLQCLQYASFFLFLPLDGAKDLARWAFRAWAHVPGRVVLFCLFVFLSRSFVLRLWIVNTVVHSMILTRILQFSCASLRQCEPWTVVFVVGFPPRLPLFVNAVSQEGFGGEVLPADSDTVFFFFFTHTNNCKIFTVNPPSEIQSRASWYPPMRIWLCRKLWVVFFQTRSNHFTV